MSDETQLPLTEDDFSFDLSDAKLTMKLLPVGAYQVEIVEQEVAPSKNNPAARNLVITFATLADHASDDSVKAGDAEARDISAGRKLKKWFPLQQSTNDKAPDFKADLARLYMAVFNCAQSELPRFNPNNSLVGRQLIIQVGISKVDPNSSFGPSNEVLKMLPIQAE